MVKVSTMRIANVFIWHIYFFYVVYAIVLNHPPYDCYTFMAVSFFEPNMPIANELLDENDGESEINLKEKKWGNKHKVSCVNNF